MKPPNGVCAIVLNLCYNQLIITQDELEPFCWIAHHLIIKTDDFKQGLHAFRRPVDLAYFSLSHR